MNAMTSGKIVMGGLIGIVGSMLGGCMLPTKAPVITQYQNFYRPDQRRIAVLPFQNSTPESGIGLRMSNQISNGLANSGAYEVFTRHELGDVLQERELAEAGIITDEMARRLGNLRSVHLLVTGSIDRYEIVTQKEVHFKRIPIWSTDSHGKRTLMGFDKTPETWTYHRAMVECNVKVIDTTTGRQVAQIHEVIDRHSRGSQYVENTTVLLRQAEQEVVARVVEALAPPPGELVYQYLGK